MIKENPNERNIEIGCSCRKPVSYSENSQITIKQKHTLFLIEDLKNHFYN